MPYMSETFIVGAQLSICFLATFPIEKKSSLGFGAERWFRFGTAVYEDLFSWGHCTFPVIPLEVLTTQPKTSCDSLMCMK